MQERRPRSLPEGSEGVRTRQERQYHGTPSHSRFIRAHTRYVVGIGPRGEGKTTMGVMALMYQARRLMANHPEYRPLRVAVVRDTRRNLGLTTAKTVQYWFPKGVASRWRGKEEEPEWCQLLGERGEAVVECAFFGVDHAEDLDKFQSYECGAVWLEEPAPAATLSGGVSSEVLAMAVSSCRQVPEQYRRIQVTCNPPDVGHWLCQLWPEVVDEPLVEGEVSREVARIRAETTVVKIAKGENPGIDQAYRQGMRDMFVAMGRMDLVARLVEGQVGEVQVGVGVTPEFTSGHVVEGLKVVPGRTVLLSYDFGQTPACCVLQVSPLGYLQVPKVFCGFGMGMKQLVEREIAPWVASECPPGVRLLHTGDPSGLHPEQSDSNVSAVREILEQLGGEGYIAGPKSPAELEAAVHDCLNRYQGGVPWVRLDKREAASLVQALSYRWHRKKDPSGTVVSAHWVKNEASHIAEAFAYGCYCLLRQSRARSQARAKTPRTPLPGSTTRTGA